MKAVTRGFISIELPFCLLLVVVVIVGLVSTSPESAFDKCKSLNPNTPSVCNQLLNKD